MIDIVIEPQLSSNNLCDQIIDKMQIKFRATKEIMKQMLIRLEIVSSIQMTIICNKKNDSLSCWYKNKLPYKKQYRINQQTHLTERKILKSNTEERLKNKSFKLSSSVIKFKKHNNSLGKMRTTFK